MARFAAISNGMVVGLLIAEQPPTLNVPAGLSFVDTTALPGISTNGWRYNSGTGIFFEVDMTQKEQFLTALQAEMTAIGQVLDRSRSLVSAYVDRGYDSAANNAIVNADLADFGVIQFDLGNAINTLSALQALFTDAFREAAVSKWRTL